MELTENSNIFEIRMFFKHFNEIHKKMQGYFL